ncbi:hypothetical protein LO82_11775 [Vibrio vulnificus]|nr:hypothetical protein LO82_11775 [Vibrio vulnificus]
MDQLTISSYVRSLARLFGVMGANIIQLLSHSELINKPAIARSLKFAAIKKELLKRSPKGSVFYCSIDAVITVV